MSAERPGPAVHEGLFFASTDELVGEVAPMLLEGLEVGDAVVLACTDEHNAALAEELADDRVLLLPREEVYGNAVRAVAYYRDFMDARLRAGSHHVRLVGQIDFGTDSNDWDEWRRFEALYNHALAPYPLWTVCAYDTSVLPDTVVATGELTHPSIRRNGRNWSNPLYVDPVELLRLSGTDAEPVPDVEPALTIRDASNLSGLHRELRELLAAERLPGDKIDDLVLAVNEIASNAVVHGSPPVTIHVWLTGPSVVCTVTDRGPGFDDPLAGYVRGGGLDLPESRFGMWLARRLCDRLDVVRTPEGFTVRLTLHN